jgi:hypothetical protein
VVCNAGNVQEKGHLWSARRCEGNARDGPTGPRIVFTLPFTLGKDKNLALWPDPSPTRGIRGVQRARLSLKMGSAGGPMREGGIFGSAGSYVHIHQEHMNFFLWKWNKILWQGGVLSAAEYA